MDLWRFCQCKPFREVLSLLQGMKEQLETEVHFGKWWISGLHQDMPGDIHQVVSAAYRVGQWGSRGDGEIRMLVQGAVGTNGFFRDRKTARSKRQGKLNWGTSGVSWCHLIFWRLLVISWNWAQFPHWLWDFLLHIFFLIVCLVTLFQENGDEKATSVGFWALCPLRQIAEILINSSSQPKKTRTVFFWKMWWRKNRDDHLLSQVEGAEAKIKEMSRCPTGFCSWRKSLVKQWFLLETGEDTWKWWFFEIWWNILRFFLYINVMNIGTIKTYTTKHTMHVIICVHT